MEAVIYLAQVSACLGAFYVFYYLLLSRFTFFTINRWYLLITLALSFAIPRLSIPFNKEEAYPQFVKQVVHLNELQQPAQPLTVINLPLAPAQALTWADALKAAYTVSVLLLSARLLMIVFTFLNGVRKRQRTRIGSVYIVQSDKKLDNGSFFNYIFLNDDELSPEEMEQIVAHEMLHVKLYHSIDRVLVKLAQIALWFNPFVYLYARAIEENHEFEVDREVGNTTNKVMYAELLLHLSVARQGTLYHNFSMVPLKKRITMLFTKPTHKMKRVIYLLVVPVVLISCLAFAKLKGKEVKKGIVRSEKKNDDPKLRLSVIDLPDALKYVTSVRIDGKIYSKDILYKIGSACIKMKSFYGNTVIITTKTGHITYQTPADVENVKAQYVVKDKFFSRVLLKKDDGSAFYQVKLKRASGSWAMDEIGLKDKVGVIINNKLYSENDFVKLFPKDDPSYGNAVGAGRVSKSWPGGDFDTKRYDEILKISNVTSEEFLKNTGTGSIQKPSAKPQNTTLTSILRDDTVRLSAISGIEKLGKNPLVLINGKEYNKEILYKISREALKSISLFMPNNGSTKYGSRAKDGAVFIETKSGKDIYMDATEKENLLKIAAAKSKFFARITFTREDGSKYDMAFVNRVSGSAASADLPVDGKIAFIINNNVYNESDFKRLFPADKPAYGGEMGVSGKSYAEDFKKKGFNVDGYDLIFDLNARIYPIVNNKPANTGAIIPVKNPAATYNLQADSTVRARFAGKVITVTAVLGTQLIIVKNGEYFGAYTNLSSTIIKRDQDITAGQLLGFAAYDDRSGTREKIFELYKGSNLVANESEIENVINTLTAPKLNKIRNAIKYYAYTSPNKPLN